MKDEWERGKDALEIMLQNESIETVEAIAAMIADKDFRKSFKYKLVKSHIKEFVKS